LDLENTMRFRALLALIGSMAVSAGPAGAGEPRDVLNRSGETVRRVGPDGRPLAEGERPGRAPEGARAPSATPECPPAGRLGDREYRESTGPLGRVDACGRFAGAAPVPSTTGSPVTIDRMTTVDNNAFAPGGGIAFFGGADTYTLTDGSQWQSGAGTVYTYSGQVTGMENIGALLRYTIAAPPSGLIYRQTDYDGGQHSAQGSLAPVGPLVLEAYIGSSTATLRGKALVVSNEATWYGDLFNYYTAVVGSVVPFEIVYARYSGTWSEQTFNAPFQYAATGSVDFAHPISVPAAVSLAIAGPSQVPAQSTIPFSATVTFDNGVTREVTSDAGWTVDPSTVASIANGVLTTGTPPVQQQPLELHATYSQGATTLSADKAVLCVTGQEVERPDVWPMFQANARHTGFQPLTLDPAQTFAVRWQKDVGGEYALNPVTAGDGRVFVSLVTYFDDVPSLFALRATDGATTWSKQFGDIFSVNPPSYAYGSVYVQTGNHGSDTWLRAYDAVTGASVFQAPHSAQWERYLSPTIHQGSVYLNGGYYGGMYKFDAYSGAQKWFAGLPQYDEWTPAVAGGKAYAYVGEYQPGLYVQDAATGAPTQFVADASFDWDGWSMHLAPVIGTHDDVLAIHDGRLISFDTAQGQIRWQVPGTFSGQPSVAHDRIYAVNGGRLVVLDELTHGELWSWQAPEGGIVGPMIVTETHLIASTAQSVHAVDLVTHDSVWSHPVSGHLALADGTLYVAGADGVLTAIAAPIVVPSPLVSLEITGPAQMVESTTASFEAIAHYANGASVQRTLSADWSVAPEQYAAVTAPGDLTAGELIDPAHDVVLTARYSELGVVTEDTQAVRILVGIPLSDLVRRNVTKAVAIKQRIVQDLERALVLERASHLIMPDLVPLSRAICREEGAEAAIQASLVDLGSILGLAGVVPGAPLGPSPCR
jgi:PQQ-like domain